MTQLIAMLDKHGPRVLGEQLDEGALKGTWQAITVKNYEQWGMGRGNAPQEPEMKHPAYRDAREIIREQEERFQSIPSATGGKGVLEHLGF